MCAYYKNQQKFTRKFWVCVCINLIGFNFEKFHNRIYFGIVLLCYCNRVSIHCNTKFSESKSKQIVIHFLYYIFCPLNTDELCEHILFAQKIDKFNVKITFFIIHSSTKVSIRRWRSKNWRQTAVYKSDVWDEKCANVLCSRKNMVPYEKKIM